MFGFTRPLQLTLRFSSLMSDQSDLPPSRLLYKVHFCILQNVTYPLCNQRLDITGESCSPDYHRFPCDFGDTLQNPFEQNLIFYAHIYILQLSEAHRCKPNHFCCSFLLVLAESSMCAETQSQCQCLFSGQCSVFSGPPRVLHGWHPLRFGASGSSHGLS